MHRSASLGRNPALALVVASAAVAALGAGTGPETSDPADPVDYIAHALREFPVVCLTEGGHQAKAPHEFLRRLVGDEAILAAVDVVIVEFAAARHQAVLDAYIQGEDVAFDRLSRVWQDTGQSPRAPWDSPLYHELLNVIRNGNQGVPSDKRVGVLAGDPPIEGERIETREGCEASCPVRRHRRRAILRRGPPFLE